MYDCLTGLCACQTGYGNENGDGCEKQFRSYQQTCGSGFYCSGENQECSASSGRCECAGEWHEWHSLASVCSLRTYKLLSQTCGGWRLGDCLIEANSAIECDGTCKCETGYIMDLSYSYKACRAPRYGESCVWNPGCVLDFDTTTISADTSNIAPSCQQNTCQCPASHEHHRVKGWNLCLDKLNSGVTRKPVGDNCTNFNECGSLFCVKCPNATSGICMDSSSGSPSVLDTRITIATVSMATVLMFIIYLAKLH